MTRLDDKLARIRAGSDKRTDFIIADAKDPDMGPGLHAVGPANLPDGAAPRLKTREEFLKSIEAVVAQDVVDVVLTSVSNLEKLVQRNTFAGSKVKPAVRANDTTDIWRHRGATYHHHPSRPFRSASVVRAKALTDLGLYSITFTNDLDADRAALEAFCEFREDASAHGFSYFLEVFNPNVDAGLEPETVPFFVNDAIVRCLAGLTEVERPRFLKIAYNGPQALEELASYDPSLVVGVLGGGAGTTRDCFELIHQAQKYGAKVALFGRKINLAESPLDIVRLMRAVSDAALTPTEAVEDYHDALRRKGLKPSRDFTEDSEITEAVLRHG
jgi:DhnA family fructose-bisphosphate aldolase class Ia